MLLKSIARRMQGKKIGDNTLKYQGQATIKPGYKRVVFLFLCTHLLLWTLAPILFRYNLPLDAIEGTIWGQQLEWGYDKNPYLNGWMSALAISLGGESGWMIYLFSQLCVVACMWAMYKLASKMLSEVHALLSVLLLECMQYFNFHAIDFNDNTLELGLWGLAIYYFYQSTNPDLQILNSSRKYSLQTARGKLNVYHWILTGVFAGLAMMAKYYTLALLAGMFLFLVSHQKNRKFFKTFPPYAGLIAFLLICTPHVVWLFSHDFITLKYVFLRGTSEKPDWTNHFIYPVQFFWQQMQVFLPALIACAVLLIGKKPFFSPRRIKLNCFDTSFLFYVAFAPLALTLLLCFILGIKLRAGWGMPLLSAWGIILIALVQPNITARKIKGFIVFIFVLLFAQVAAYSYSLLFPRDSNTAIFPGKNIAHAITNLWRDKYHTRLEYVGGSRWVGGNISFYSADHPRVYIELDRKKAPWIKLADLEKKGGVYVWEMSQWNDLPTETRKKFEQFKDIQILTFPWPLNHAKLPPVKIGVVILPPQKQ